jgi:hypothetical protein
MSVPPRWRNLLFRGPATPDSEPQSVGQAVPDKKHNAAATSVRHSLTYELTYKLP